MTTEPLTWHEDPADLPDADTTVMLSLDETHGDPTFPGYLDGDGWRNVHGEPISGVLAWADMPRGVRRG